MKKECVKKSPIEQEYNTIGGIYHVDEMIFSYPVMSNRKWHYVKLFKHLLELFMFNAFILYKKHRGSLDHQAFRLDLIDNAVEEYHIACQKHLGRFP